MTSIWRIKRSLWRSWFLKLNLFLEMLSEWFLKGIQFPKFQGRNKEIIWNHLVNYKQIQGSPFTYFQHDQYMQPTTNNTKERSKDTMHDTIGHPVHLQSLAKMSQHQNHHVPQKFQRSLLDTTRKVGKQPHLRKWRLAKYRCPVWHTGSLVAEKISGGWQHGWQWVPSPSVWNSSWNGPCSIVMLQNTCIYNIFHIHV